MAANQNVPMEVDGSKLVDLANGWDLAAAHNYISVDNYLSFEHIMNSRAHYKLQNGNYNELQLARDLTLYDSLIVNKVYHIVETYQLYRPIRAQVQPLLRPRRHPQ